MAGRSRRATLFLLAFLGLAWIGHRFRQDHIAWRQRDTTVDMLVEGCPYEVVTVLDGRTLALSLAQPPVDYDDARRVVGRAKVRLLGIELPPIGNSTRADPTGHDDAERVIRQFLNDRTVTLRLDCRRQSTDGTLLAYVLVDDQLLNLLLVEKGLAVTDLQPGDSSEVGKWLVRAEQSAREARVGYWAK